MTKEIILTLSGTQELISTGAYDEEVTQALEEAGDDGIQVIALGEYYEKKGIHYILYDEVVEGRSIVDKNMIKIGPDKVEVTKKGGTSVQMVFEEGKKTMTNYHTPYGSIYMGVDVFSIEKRITQALIEMQIIYQLELNYEPVAMCALKLKVISKNDKNFTLQ